MKPTTNPAAALRCEMTDTCQAPVTHIDSIGFVYCTTHGNRRRGDRPCRALTRSELARVRAGLRVHRY